MAKKKTEPGVEASPIRTTPVREIDQAMREEAEGSNLREQVKGWNNLKGIPANAEDIRTQTYTTTPRTEVWESYSPEKRERILSGLRSNDASILKDFDKDIKLRLLPLTGGYGLVPGGSDIGYVDPKTYSEDKTAKARGEKSRLPTVYRAAEEAEHLENTGEVAADFEQKVDALNLPSMTKLPLSSGGYKRSLDVASSGNAEYTNNAEETRAKFITAARQIGEHPLDIAARRGVSMDKAIDIWMNDIYNKSNKSEDYRGARNLLSNYRDVMQNGTPQAKADLKKYLITVFQNFAQAGTGRLPVSDSGFA